MNKQTETEFDAVSSYPVGYFEWQKEIDKIEPLRCPRVLSHEPAQRGLSFWRGLDQLVTR